MRACLFFLILLAPTLAMSAEHATWPDYLKANRFACPGPFDTLKTPRTLKLGGKTYTHTGYRLEVKDPDADSTVKIGLISAIKDVSAGTKQNLTQAIAWFKESGVEWLVVNGDLALEEFDLEEVLDMLAAPGLPVLIVLGNSESTGSFARAYRDRMDKFPHLINGVLVRQIVADDVELWSLPGYHDRRFSHQGASCSYKETHVEAMSAALTPAGSAPVVLVSHGPPAGKGKNALDWISERENVGDPAVSSMINKKGIPFGFFGHILEAGGNAVGKDLSTPVAADKLVPALFVNAGSLSGDPWGMNDGSTSNGMAFLVTLEAGKAKYAVKRFKPTAEE